MTLECEHEHTDVLELLQATRPADVPDDLREQVRERLSADAPPAPPWGAFEEHAQELFGYALVLLEGDAWMAELVLVKTFVEVDSQGEPSLAELLQAARHAALDVIVKVGFSRQESTLSAGELALLLERRLGLSLQQLAQTWSQMPARLDERLRGCGGRLLRELARGEPQACPTRKRIPAALLDLLEPSETEAHAIHLESCATCAGWTRRLEDAMPPTPRALPAPEKTAQRLREQLEPSRSPAELGIQVAVSCCFCHDRLRRREAAFCAACLAPHHPDCFQQHGRCATPGCTGLEVVYPSSVGPEHAARPSPRLGLVAGLMGLLVIAAAAWSYSESRDLGRASTQPSVPARTRTKVQSKTARPTPSRATESKGLSQPIVLKEDTKLLPVTAGEYTVPHLMTRWASDRGLTLSIDPLIATVRIKLHEADSLDRTRLRALLKPRSVVLIVGPGQTLQVIHQRNMFQRLPDAILVEGDTPVDPDSYVSRVVKLRHGGNAIFSSVRAIMVRDTNRVGNVLFNPDSGLLTIIDLARKVRFYEEMALNLDRPISDPIRARVEAFRVSPQLWTKLRGLKNSDLLARLLELARSTSQCTLVESADLDFDRIPDKESRVFERSLGETSVKLDAWPFKPPSGGPRKVLLILKAWSTKDKITTRDLQCSLPLSGSSANVQATLLPGGDHLVLAVSTR